MKKILAFFLVLSLLANVYFVWYQQQPVGEEQIQEMQGHLNSLEKENHVLKAEVAQDNLSLQSYASQVDFYRRHVSQLESKLGSNSETSSSEPEGSAILEAPAVFQRVETVQDGPFARQMVSESGTLINISTEVRSGAGRVLVQTTPLMGVVFQDAANTAVFVAQNKTNTSLLGSDTIFSIHAEDEIPGVDGPSAGALMTLLTIAALDDRVQLNDSITLTGTIDSDGKIGPIGGVFEKAQAAKAGGKKLILLPEENSQFVLYKTVTKQFHGFTLTEQKPTAVDTKAYIEKNIGIKVEYVDSIDDVLKYEDV